MTRLMNKKAQATSSSPGNREARGGRQKAVHSDRVRCGFHSHQPTVKGMARETSSIDESRPGRRLHRGQCSNQQRAGGRLQAVHGRLHSSAPPTGAASESACRTIVTPESATATSDTPRTANGASRTALRRSSSEIWAWPTRRLGATDPQSGIAGGASATSTVLVTGRRGPESKLAGRLCENSCTVIGMPYCARAALPGTGDRTSDWRKQSSLADLSFGGPLNYAGVISLTSPFGTRQPALGLPLAHGLIGHIELPGQAGQPDDLDCL